MHHITQGCSIGLKPHLYSFDWQLQSRRNLLISVREWQIERDSTIYSTARPKEELAVLARDAEKALDQIEWPYLFEILERFKLG